MSIIKSSGHTPSEALLSKLCDKVFLKLWCYANPYQSPGKELCDVLAVFENHVFIFFDRESRKFDYKEKTDDLVKAWNRWLKEVIEKQIKSANGAERYILQNQDKIYLNAQCTTHFPIKIL